MLQSMVMAVAKNGVSSAIVNATGIVDKLLPVSDSSLIGRSALNGTSLAVAKEVVDFFDAPAESNISKMDFLGIVDNVFFTSAVCVGVEVSGAGKTAYETLKSVSPISSPMFLNSIIDGSVMTLSRVVTDYYDKTPDANQYLRNLPHVTRLVMNK